MEINDYRQDGESNELTARILPEVAEPPEMVM